MQARTKQSKIKQPARQARRRVDTPAERRALIERLSEGTSFVMANAIATAVTKGRAFRVQITDLVLIAVPQTSFGKIVDEAIKRDVLGKEFGFGEQEAVTALDLCGCLLTANAPARPDEARLFSADGLKRALTWKPAGEKAKAKGGRHHVH